MRGRILVLVAGICTWLYLPGPASAAKVTLELTASSLSTHTPAIQTLGSYYTLQFDVPGRLKGHELHGAFLEFYLDVTASPVQGQTNPTPMLEVYALKSAFEGSLDVDQFRESAFGPRNVVLGQSHRVLLDITDIVKAYMADPSGNHGLIIGALTGERDGLFAIKPNVIGQGLVASVTFHYRR